MSPDRAPYRMRTAAALGGTACLLLLAAACGSSPRHVAQLARLGGTTTTSTERASTSPAAAAVAYAHCMRSHGVASWPDPTSAGVFDKSKLTPDQLGASASRIQAAQGSCRSLLPGGNVRPSPARVQQIRAQALRFARCLRAHGVPGFPDPGSDGRIPDPASVGVDQGSPRFEAANRACASYRPPYMPSNAAYNSWAQTHRS